jgi:diguanylate cyclase (GGDEF)-like protein
MAGDNAQRLKLQILKLINSQSSNGVNKYNLVGRDFAGELELSLHTQWTTEQRAAAAIAFDELKRSRLIQSTMTDTIDPDNWVTITAAGRDALSAGALRDGRTGDATAQIGDDELLMQTLSTELQRARPTAVIYADLDNFKAVNDTLGHDAGDRCIEGFKQAVGQVIEGRGHVYRRYARGDEFVIVLPNCTTAEATATAERIRRTVELSDIGGTVPVTASLGVHSSDIGSLTDPRELVNCADKMMLTAKQRKNIVAALETGTVIATETLSKSLEQWVLESNARWKSIVHERISAEHPMAYFSHGTWSFAYAIATDRARPQLKDLQQILRDMPGQTKCLHPWRVPAPREKKPYPFEGVLECWPAEETNGYSPEFWRASPELKMFYLRRYAEDEDDEENQTGLAGSRLDLTNPIWRLGECALHAAVLSEALRLPSGLATFCVELNGLKGRRLTTRRPGLSIEDWRCRQDSVESQAALPVCDLRAKLQQLVASLLARLYEAFGVFDPIDELLRVELLKMLDACVASN